MSRITMKAILSECTPQVGQTCCGPELGYDDKWVVESVSEPQQDPATGLPMVEVTLVRSSSAIQ